MLEKQEKTEGPADIFNKKGKKVELKLKQIRWLSNHC